MDFCEVWHSQKKAYNVCISEIALFLDLPEKWPQLICDSVPAFHSLTKHVHLYKSNNLQGSGLPRWRHWAPDEPVIRVPPAALI